MSSRSESIFCYGTFMAPEVLAAQGLGPRTSKLARLGDFALKIRPRANLEWSDGASVYGSVMELTALESARLYDGLQRESNILYSPHQLTVDLLDHGSLPALCYIATDMNDAPPAPEYVKKLALIVRALGFPESYARHVESFDPGPG